MATGILESLSLSGMKGLKASSVTSTGIAGSLISTRAKGYSPLKVTLRKCGRPSPVRRRVPCPSLVNAPSTGPWRTFAIEPFFVVARMAK